MAIATIDLPGGIILSYLAKTANYTVGAFDSTIDCTANSFTVTLPTAIGIPGRTYVVKNSGAGTITVATTSSQTIDGASTDVLAPAISRTYQSDGANWIIVTISQQYLQGIWTPVVTLVGGSGNTVPVYSTNSGDWTRIGRLVFFNIVLSGDGGAEGAGTGAMHISLPFSTSSGQLAVRSVSGRAVNGANETLISLQFSASSGTVALWQGAADLTTFKGSSQNNVTRSIVLSGFFFV